MNVATAVYFRPAMRTARLFMPDFDKTEFFLQLRIAHDFVPQRSGPGRDYLNDCLHFSLLPNVSAGNQFLCNVSLIPHVPEIKAKGVRSPQPEATPQDFRNQKPSALKARLISAASIESRFQRFPIRGHRSPGALPQAELKSRVWRSHHMIICVTEAAIDTSHKHRRILFRGGGRRQATCRRF